MGLKGSLTLDMNCLWECCTGHGVRLPTGSTGGVSRSVNISISGRIHMAPSTVVGLSNLQDHLSLVCNRPRARDIPFLSKALRAQATNCVRHSAENNDLLEFLGDRLVNLITALIVEEVKVDKCHHTVRLSNASFFCRIRAHGA